ncbi:phosphate ABC transporter substrate-binding protein [Enterovibrio nigricans]|uniref:Phosphate ABC transporter substrate-binding protein, PhoT family n=1 Tax=Enterovibrio nigricans DSM 22720 TaxID=1121868 RepID=A0A1T4UDP9_9GAMM|nr:phosphate ABC transporter substrate-binding protein [Enterovibrio nigricans]PKF50746.1 phosphate ABC transporter substrate-binding protein [Enterovibrio nigricans]SKA50875.1 phosphate ABC transporter substrate-binding protein, PhoT family [Enterovibrio nigricans DSM 22720]
MLFRLIALVFSFIIPFANAASEDRLTVSGSTSVTYLIDVLSEHYEKETGQVIEVQGTGSSAGILAVNKGISELGMSSRYLKNSEIMPDLKTHVIAYDGLTLVVHPENPVVSLTSKQISEIYRGKITNWRQVGGEDQKIAVVSRELASGSRYSFESFLGLTRVYKGAQVSDISASLLVVNANSMVKMLVSNNKHAMGYISAGTIEPSIKSVAVDGVSYSLSNMEDGSYKLSRPFLLLHKKDELSDISQNFLNYVLSAKSQKLAASMGFIPVIK